MLSRIAESLFWIGRYVERADDTARILDVQTQRLVEDPTLDERRWCRLMLSTMGAQPEGRVDRDTVLQALAYDRTSPASITNSLEAARESARGAREILSTDMWEALNTTWRMLPTGRFQAMKPDVAFSWVRQRAALLAGIADATISRDETYNYMVLGRSIERADMTARLLSTTALANRQVTDWSSALHACGAYEAFLRTYRGMEADTAAVEFLVLDRLFPRSIVFALNLAEKSLVTLHSGERRTGFGDEAHRLLGRARADLEYRAFPDLLDDLPGEMTRLQQSLQQATEAIARSYFEGAVAMTWTGEGR